MWVQELPTCHSIFGCPIMEKISRPLKPNVCKGVVKNRSAFVALPRLSDGQLSGAVRMARKVCNWGGKQTHLGNEKRGSLSNTTNTQSKRPIGSFEVVKWNHCILLVGCPLLEFLIIVPQHWKVGTVPIQTEIAMEDVATCNIGESKMIPSHPFSTPQKSLENFS